MLTAKQYGLIAITALTISAIAAGYLFFANTNKAELDTRWAKHNAASTDTVDHDPWQLILDDYLISDTDDGVNLFDYAGLLDDGREPLDDYLTALTQTDPLTLNRAEQKAYWFNLYNAATVQLIIDNYPLKSITQLGSNPTEFGPWNENAVAVNGIDLSLNDIEHRIIRPLYSDYRIHFAVNCASIGCPNLAADAFTADTLDQQLDDAARDYLNHPRGIHFTGSALTLSTLFKWYADDFGANQSDILTTLAKHTDAETQSALASFTGSPNYDYDWALNGYCSIDDACGE